MTNRDPLPLPSELRWRRLALLTVFFVFLYLFHGLAATLIVFSIGSTMFLYLADALAHRLKWGATRSRIALLATLGIACVVTMVGAWPLARPKVQAVSALANKEILEIQTQYLLPPSPKNLPSEPHYGHLDLEHPEAVPPLLDPEKKKEPNSESHHNNSQEGRLKEFLSLAKYVAKEAFVSVFYAFLGFLLAIIYAFEREEVAEFNRRIPKQAVSATLIRWLSHLSYSIVLMFKMQTAVALVNTVLSGIFIILFRLPNSLALIALVFLLSFVPAVGSMVAGLAICIVAYQSSGIATVLVFAALTAVLGKVESYYISPKLAAAHVHLPSIYFVLALVLCEQVFGPIGLFLSFPIVYVSAKILQEWAEEDCSPMDYSLADTSTPPIIAASSPPVEESTESPDDQVSVVETGVPIQSDAPPDLVSHPPQLASSDSPPLPPEAPNDNTRQS